MCAPVAIPIAMMVIAAAGTAYSMHAEKQQASYEQQVDDNNAKLANTEAQNANNEGSYAADQARIRGNLLRGQQMATFAANNVEESTGSPAQILGDTAMMTSQDMQQARINGAMKAYGYQVQAANDTSAGSYAAYSGSVQQGTTLLNGTSSMLGSAQKSGFFNG